MKKFKISAILVTFVVFITAFSRLVNADTNLNLAVVDVTAFQQQFVTEVNDKLKEEFKQQQAELQKSLDEFNKDKENFDKNSKTMTNEQANKAANKLSETQMQLQGKIQEFDQKIATRRQEELQQRLNKLFDVVQKISNVEKYDMVLAKTAALFVADKYDITKKVIDGYKEASK
jgi:outer membrane protein